MLKDLNTFCFIRLSCNVCVLYQSRWSVVCWQTLDSSLFYVIIYSVNA